MFKKNKEKIRNLKCLNCGYINEWSEIGEFSRTCDRCGSKNLIKIGGFLE